MQTKYSEIMYNTYVKEVEKSGILNLANYRPDNTDDSFCLFGRTKAGKSTTMEALTSGDGSSIGIGKQV